MSVPVTFTELIAHPFWWLTRWFYDRALRVPEREAHREDQKRANRKQSLRYQALERKRDRQATMTGKMR